MEALLVDAQAEHARAAADVDAAEAQLARLAPAAERERRRAADRVAAARRLADAAERKMRSVVDNQRRVLAAVEADEQLTAEGWAGIDSARLTDVSVSLHSAAHWQATAAREATRTAEEAVASARAFNPASAAEHFLATALRWLLARRLISRQFHERADDDAEPGHPQPDPATDGPPHGRAAELSRAERMARNARAAATWAAGDDQPAAYGESQAFTQPDLRAQPSLAEPAATRGQRSKQRELTGTDRACTALVGTLLRRQEPGRQSDAENTAPAAAAASAAPGAAALAASPVGPTPAPTASSAASKAAAGARTRALRTAAFESLVLGLLGRDGRLAEPDMALLGRAAPVLGLSKQTQVVLRETLTAAVSDAVSLKGQPVEQAAQDGAAMRAALLGANSAASVEVRSSWVRRQALVLQAAIAGIVAEESDAWASRGETAVAAASAAKVAASAAEEALNDVIRAADKLRAAQLAQQDEAATAGERRGGAPKKGSAGSSGSAGSAGEGDASKDSAAGAGAGPGAPRDATRALDEAVEEAQAAAAEALRAMQAAAGGAALPRLPSALAADLAATVVEAAGLEVVSVTGSPDVGGSKDVDSSAGQWSIKWCDDFVALCCVQGRALGALPLGAVGRSRALLQGAVTFGTAAVTAGEPAAEAVMASLPLHPVAADRIVAAVRAASSGDADGPSDELAKWVRAGAAAEPSGALRPDEGLLESAERGGGGRGGDAVWAAALALTQAAVAIRGAAAAAAAAAGTAAAATHTEASGGGGGGGDAGDGVSAALRRAVVASGRVRDPSRLSIDRGGASPADRVEQAAASEDFSAIAIGRRFGATLKKRDEKGGSARRRAEAAAAEAEAAKAGGSRAQGAGDGDEAASTRGGARDGAGGPGGDAGSDAAAAAAAAAASVCVAPAAAAAPPSVRAARDWVQAGAARLAVGLVQALASRGGFAAEAAAFASDALAAEAAAACVSPAGTEDRDGCSEAIRAALDALAPGGQGSARVAHILAAAVATSAGRAAAVGSGWQSQGWLDPALRRITLSADAIDRIVGEIAVTSPLSRPDGDSATNPAHGSAADGGEAAESAAGSSPEGDSAPAVGRSARWWLSTAAARALQAAGAEGALAREVEGSDLSSGPVDGEGAEDGAAAPSPAPGDGGGAGETAEERGTASAERLSSAVAALALAERADEALAAVARRSAGAERDSSAQEAAERRLCLPCVALASVAPAVTALRRMMAASATSSAGACLRQAAVWARMQEAQATRRTPATSSSAARAGAALPSQGDPHPASEGGAATVRAVRDCMAAARGGGAGAVPAALAPQLCQGSAAILGDAVKTLTQGMAPAFLAKLAPALPTPSLQGGSAVSSAARGIAGWAGSLITSLRVPQSQGPADQQTTDRPASGGLPRGADAGGAGPASPSGRSAQAQGSAAAAGADVAGAAVPSAASVAPAFGLFAARLADLLALLGAADEVAAAVRSAPGTASSSAPSEGSPAGPTEGSAEDALPACRRRIARAIDAVASCAAAQLAFVSLRGLLFDALYNPTPADPDHRLAPHLPALEELLAALQGALPGPSRAVFSTRTAECVLEAWTRCLLHGGSARRAAPEDAPAVAADLEALVASLASALPALPDGMLERLARPARQVLIGALASPTDALLMVVDGRAKLAICKVAKPERLPSGVAGGAAEAGEGDETDEEEDGDEAEEDGSGERGGRKGDAEGAEGDLRSAVDLGRIDGLFTSKALHQLRAPRLVAALCLLHRADPLAVEQARARNLPALVAASMQHRPAKPT